MDGHPRRGLHGHPPDPEAGRGVGRRAGRRARRALCGKPAADGHGELAATSGRYALTSLHVQRNGGDFNEFCSKIGAFWHPLVVGPCAGWWGRFQQVRPPAPVVIAPIRGLCHILH